ncbi:hypothetical protein CIPAW_02G048800 [Carya illinoinensis]|uniref:Uncharacterized protein n=1 Tax=Carya illinoinensis TaxID=32201 RepID=A0A8T1RB01_CARIL|nr:hypothetical protein CIPAW_02G048800 [Carya illinoinensis]
MKLLVQPIYFQALAPTSSLCYVPPVRVSSVAASLSKTRKNNPSSFLCLAPQKNNNIQTAPSRFSTAPCAFISLFSTLSFRPTVQEKKNTELKKNSSSPA